MIGKLGIRPQLRTNALYVITMFFVGVGLVALAWFTVHFIMVTLQPICYSVAENVGSNTTLYNQVDAFFITFLDWLGVIGLLCLVLGAWQYSQKKGYPVYPS